MLGNSHFSFIGFAVTAALLTSCGGSSGGSGSEPGPTAPPAPDDGFLVVGQPSVSGTFKYFGYVDLIVDSPVQQIDRDTNFFEMTEPQSTNAFLTIPPAVNQCRLRITDSIPSDSAAIGFPTETFTLASAGETMTLTGPDGTYATAAFTDDRLDFAPFPAPDELTLDLPGMAFPAFSNVSIPPLILPTNFQLSTGDELRVGTEFTWDVANSVDNTLHLSMATIAANSQFVTLNCRMNDTGTYRLPTTVENALVSALGSDFALTGAAIDEKAVNIVTQGDALLVVSRRNKFQ